MKKIVANRARQFFGWLGKKSKSQCSKYRRALLETVDWVETHARVAGITRGRRVNKDLLPKESVFEFSRPNRIIPLQVVATKDHVGDDGSLSAALSKYVEWLKRRDPKSWRSPCAKDGEDANVSTERERQIQDEELRACIRSFRKEFPASFDKGTIADFDVLPAMYARAFYFGDGFAPARFEKGMCDGHNDGGIDAVFANPREKNNEVIIVQSKCYAFNNSLKEEQLEEEICKIFATLRQFRAGKSGENTRSRRAFEAAKNQCEDPDNIAIVIDVVTSWIPADGDPKVRRLSELAAKLERRGRKLGVCKINIVYGDMLKDRALNYDQEKPLVEHGFLSWITGNGMLSYRQSCVLNISAKSLHELYEKQQEAALGLNLRYHVGRGRLQRNVDNGMHNTMKDRPHDFWLYNNGLMIVCSRFKPHSDGCLELWDFSIVNGGQTTFNIHEYWGDVKVNDFAVQCKIVKVDGIERGKGGKLAQKLAEGVNSQKPISMAQLRSNNKEQVDLGARFKNYNVYYVRKLGVNIDNGKSWRFKPSIEDVGRLGLAAVTLRPVAARNNKDAMFDAWNYERIFNPRLAGLYADLLRVREIYKGIATAIKHKKPRWCQDKDEAIIAKRADTFVIAVLMLALRGKLRLIKPREFGRTVKGGSEKPYSGLCAKLGDISHLFEVDREPDYGSVEILLKEFVHVVYKGFKNQVRDLKEDAADAEGFMKKSDAFKRYVAPEVFAKLKKKTFKRTLDSIFDI